MSETTTLFAERGRNEATANPIFLFQVRRWIHTGYPTYSGEGDFEYCSDGEGIILGTVDSKRHWTPLENAEYLTNEAMAEMDNSDGVPCAVETWRTERVFLSREAGEAFGRRHAYRWEDGWRVYCVPCDEEIAAMIRECERMAKR